ncbi:MAG: TraX family protein [Aerococcus sp.]|nr:TraX family protein [Aerococcus sp.]
MRLNLFQNTIAFSHPKVKRPHTKITGITLKIIAMGTMIIDHLAIVLWSNVTLTMNGLWFGDGNIPLPYLVMRLIGRIAFPLFAFLLVEGFWHTRNVWEYAKRLFLMAVISEIPYDLALHQTWIDWGSQNVFFTLLLALGALWGIEYYRDLKPEIGFLIVMLMGVIAEILHTDYQSFGVGLVVILYVLHERPQLESLWGSLLCLFEGMSVIGSFILTSVYNGERGRGNGRVWYWIYPLHLLVFAFIRSLLLK